MSFGWISKKTTEWIPSLLTELRFQRALSTVKVIPKYFQWSFRESKMDFGKGREF